MRLYGLVNVTMGSFDGLSVERVTDALETSRRCVQRQRTLVKALRRGLAG